MVYYRGGEVILWEGLEGGRAAAGCKGGGHLKPISRELHRQLYGRSRNKKKVKIQSLWDGRGLTEPLSGHI